MNIKVVLWVEGHHHGAVVVLPAAQVVSRLLRRDDMAELHKNLAVCMAHQHCVV